MKLLQFMCWKICSYKFEWELLTLIKKMCEYDLIWKLKGTSAQQYMQYVWFRQLWVGFHVNRLCGVQIFLQLLHSVRRKYVINNWIMIMEFSVCTTNMTHRSRGSMNYCKCNKEANQSKRPTNVVLTWFAVEKCLLHETIDFYVNI